MLPVTTSSSLFSRAEVRPDVLGAPPDVEASGTIAAEVDWSGWKLMVACFGVDASGVVTIKGDAGGVGVGVGVGVGDGAATAVTTKFAPA